MGKTEIKVGIFVLLTVIGLVYLSIRINSKGFSLKGQKTIYVNFESASGLLLRTPVEYAGIRVGYVEAIDLEGTKARVTIKVDPKIPVYEDSEVGLHNRGILGEKILAIKHGGNKPEIPDGGSIDAQVTGGGIDDAFRNFNEIAQAVKDLIKGGDGKPSLRDIISNVTEVSEDLRSLVRSNRQELNDIVKNVHGVTKMLNEGDLKEIIVNLKETSTNIKAFVNSADPQLREAVSNFKGVMTKIDDTVSTLNRVVAKVDRGEGTLGKLLNDETTITKVNETLDGVNDFVGRVRRLEVSVGFRGEYLSSAQASQSTASFKLQPSEDKYFLFEFTNGPLADSQRKTTITDYSETPGTSKIITEKIRKDSFSFSFIFAKRFYDLTLKAGLFRSSGGFGAEYHLFRDRLSFGADLFDLSREENPHLRLYMMAHLFKIFHIGGGVDDVIQQNGRRNYFGSVGLLLTDSDLKSLVSLAPIISR
jgi:phospholipid/cholesterol/gamma-HCH transport system substrate-binding protein